MLVVIIWAKLAILVHKLGPDNNYELAVPLATLGLHYINLLSGHHSSQKRLICLGPDVLQSGFGSKFLNFRLANSRKIARKFLPKLFQRIFQRTFRPCFSGASGPPPPQRNSRPKQFTPKIHGTPLQFQNLEPQDVSLRFSTYEGDFQCWAAVYNIALHKIPSCAGGPPMGYNLVFQLDAEIERWPIAPLKAPQQPQIRGADLVTAAIAQLAAAGNVVKA